MPCAIRITGDEIVTGLRHADLLLKWLEDSGLTHDQGDDLIFAGLIEFGNTWLDPEIWARSHTLTFEADNGSRKNVYISVDAIISNTW